MHACILGSGIIGLATAYELHQRGCSVTVIDARPGPGEGASAGNGAQLSYSYVQPLADPAIWKQLPKLFLEPDSPLKFRLQADPRQWRWGLEFLAACNAGRSHATTRALLELAAHSRAGYDAMLAATGMSCDFAQPGKLVLYLSEAGVAGARQQVALQAQMGGSPQSVLGRDETLAIEPALTAYGPRIAGAVHTPSECVADCHLVCTGLAAWLAERGVRFLYGTEVQGIVSAGGRARAVRTSAGEIEADQFVVSLGWQSPQLLRPLGEHLPVYPLKGYSITLDVAEAPDAAAPRVSITDTSRKVVFARVGQRLRVAGMVELVGPDTRLDPTKIASLRNSTRAVFPSLQNTLTGDCAAWTGMRPATPTGLPITRAAQGTGNLWINTGHGALGFTLAFGSAAQLADAIVP
ncbi:FAD-dependent oxidoreductase [Corticibacter populi]|uniref:FAD-dependent oxidoreductase n=1 Tax=Corticibacter populi TaxID=1550736 RepID=A0A3M6QUJ5_9BURK|nr:D-amino acid dehydrogenase [Corticibacter populi]RMX06551.1 FAD-dependent oxidoreductase [Corticibacter populi]RZS31884.1 D-amino-acid dehydrogenase [Corticibacter populi]